MALTGIKNILGCATYDVNSGLVRNCPGPLLDLEPIMLMNLNDY